MPSEKSVPFPLPDVQSGDIVENFQVTRVAPLPGLRATAIEAVHQASGARFLHVLSGDEENLFSIAFRTPPSDDTGVPHILEHSVLNGSRKYPVKDPFVEMLKTSMATFLNAMTYPDKTVYPVASNLEADFFNLADVYCDAVFHPRITALTFKQEGHHLAPVRAGDPASPLRINGIVYNEMKGAYSDVDALNHRLIERNLFPDSPYGRDSGGDPAAIPDLTYEQFQRFYRSLYHPSNARIFVCGDIPTRHHLRFLDQRLRDCPPPPENPVDTSIPRQPRWLEPRQLLASYPADDDADADCHSMITLNWLVGDCTEPLLDLAMELLGQLLFGNASAPLHKALVDSHLGKDLTMCGYESGTYETSFHAGLKGTSPRHREAFENLVFETLRKTVRQGFDPERIAVAFHQMQYGHREINSHFPLKIMSWAYNCWIYDLDPLVYYHTGELLDQLAVRIADDPAFLTGLIEERLLDNPHRLTLTAQPDADLQEARDQEMARHLAEVKAGMSRERLREIARDAEQLAREQKRPNSPEALATLPQLPVSAIPPRPREIPTELVQPNPNLDFLHNRLFTNQVNYLNLAFDLAGMPSDLRPFVPLFCLLFSQLGTEHDSYEVMARRIAGSAARLQAQDFATTSALDPERISTCLMVGLVTLDESLERALGIIRDLLFSLDFSDRQRLRDVLEQTRERYVSGVIPNGHRLAALHAGRSLSPLAAFGEQASGVPQIRLLDRLSGDFDRQADGLVGRLERIKRHLLQGGRITASFAGSEAQAELALAWTVDLHKSLGSNPAAAADSGTAFDFVPAAAPLEGLAFMADVAYCAVCLPAPHFSDSRSVPLKLLAHILNYDYMWENVRVLGGAYGAACAYDPGLSMVKLISHQDPSIVNTMQVCQALPDYLENLRIPPETLDRARIACAKNNQRPIRPESATNSALARHLSGLTPETRARRRQYLLTVSPDEVLRVGLEVFREGMVKAQRCAISSRSRLTAARDELTMPMSVENLLDPRPGGA